jgi:type II secretory pathway pseudopilin PulG
MFKVISSKSSTHHSSLLLKLSHPSTGQGFTMFEVLIAVMISFLFLTGTLNAMVMATVMHVKAERQARANYWIKEDLEQVRALANNFDPPTGNGCPSGVGAAFNTASTANSGLANSTSPATTVSTRTILGKTIRLTRTATVSGNVLTLNYLAEDPAIANADQAKVAQLYSEVLPRAALSCD